MPIPPIRIDDPQSRGLPRQAVPLRLAYLITGLSFDNFLFLLADRQEGLYEYLTGYEYAAGSEPREVRRERYKRIEKEQARLPDATEADLVALLPRDHFVWSDELADAFSRFVRDCPGYEEAQRQGMGLSWTPALREFRALIEDCIDLACSAAYREPDPRIMQPGRVLGVDAENAKQDADSIRLLHVSDLHFTKGTPVSARLQWLLDDIRLDKSLGGLGFKELDYLVITGDFTDKGSEEGFKQAYEFVSSLLHEFNLSAERCILVPGNHDVVDIRSDNQTADPNPEPDALRFEKFSDLLYRKLLGRPYPEQYAEQGTSILFPDTGIQFLTLNSCWKIDSLDRKRSGVHEPAVANAIKQAQKQERDARLAGQMASDQPLLRIAVWHHAVAGPQGMEETDFLGHLQKNGVRLVLHGDVHEMQRDQIGYRHETRIHIVGSGSFGSGAEGLSPSTPRLFNVLEIVRDLKSVRVYTRRQRKLDGAWDGWHEWHDPNGGAGRLPYYDVDL